MAAEGDLLNRINVAEFWFKLLYVVRPHHPGHADRDSYAYETLYAVSIMLAKLSILLFYSRIFKEKRFLRWVKILIALVMVDWLAAQLTIILECLPIQALWDPTVSGTCINLITFFVASGAVNVAIDFAILVLPLPMIWSLEIERHHKYALSGVFLLGSFVVIVAIVRVVVMSQIAIVDITWEFVDAALWTAGEPSIAVTSASLPILRSLWIWNRRKRTDRYGAETPDSYAEPKSLGGPGGGGGGGRRSRTHGFRKQGSLESAKYPLNDLPAGVQQVFGNRVTIASNGQSRKLSDETDAYADLPIMHPQGAGMSPYRPPQPPSHILRPEHAYPSQRSSGLPSNRSELYG